MGRQVKGTTEKEEQHPCQSPGLGPTEELVAGYREWGRGTRLGSRVLDMDGPRIDMRNVMMVMNLF